MGRLNCKLKDSRSKFLTVCSLLLALSFLTGCAISHGVYHTVERGQTLWRIAKTYEVDIQDIAEFNDITDPTQINAGQRLFIPGAWQVLRVEPYKLTDAGADAAGKNTKTINHVKEEPAEKIVLEKWRFSWPLKGRVISNFGIRDGKKHDGIDIAAAYGASVLAADDGEVIYSDNSVRRYGYMIIVQHKDGFVTVYAHNKENLAEVGDMVKRGDVIASLGNSGNASGSHLHFEIRKNRKPRNPLFFLP